MRDVKLVHLWAGGEIVRIVMNAHKTQIVSQREAQITNALWTQGGKKSVRKKFRTALTVAPRIRIALIAKEKLFVSHLFVVPNDLQEASPLLLLKKFVS